MTPDSDNLWPKQIVHTQFLVVKPEALSHRLTPGHNLGKTVCEIDLILFHKLFLFLSYPTQQSVY